MRWIHDPNYPPSTLYTRHSSPLFRLAAVLVDPVKNLAHVFDLLE